MAEVGVARSRLPPLGMFKGRPGGEPAAASAWAEFLRWRPVARQFGQPPHVVRMVEGPLLGHRLVYSLGDRTHDQVHHVVPVVAEPGPDRCRVPAAPPRTAGRRGAARRTSSRCPRRAPTRICLRLAGPFRSSDLMPDAGSGHGRADARDSSDSPRDCPRRTRCRHPFRPRVARRPGPRFTAGSHPGSFGHKSTERTGPRACLGQLPLFLAESPLAPSARGLPWLYGVTSSAHPAGPVR